jgi:serine/threonine-protein kinase
MANLWVARHLALDTEVVAKILGTAADADSAGRQRFLREARLAARVSSLHVVRILDSGVGATAVGDRPFLVMELLRGEDLAARISRKGRLSVAETMTVVEHIALALEKAHGMGIAHRDVKPSNVFLVEGPGGFVAKLIDFGIAKDDSEPHVELTRAGSLMGTPPYMSPEQVVGAADIDSRCDLWSLAVVAYSCLTGRLPFDGDTFGAVCVAIHAGRFDPPSVARSELSPRIDAFFARALCRTLELRYRGARELSEAFRAATWSDANASSLEGSAATPGPAVEDAMLWATTRLALDDLERVGPDSGSSVDGLQLDGRLAESGILPTARGRAERRRAERGRM